MMRAPARIAAEIVTLARRASMTITTPPARAAAGTSRRQQVNRQRTFRMHEREVAGQGRERAFAKAYVPPICRERHVRNYDRQMAHQVVNLREAFARIFASTGRPASRPNSMDSRSNLGGEVSGRVRLAVQPRARGRCSWSTRARSGWSSAISRRGEIAGG